MPREKQVVVKLSRRDWERICEALDWVEAAGDHSEFIDSMSSPLEADLFWQAAEKFRMQGTAK